MLTLQSLAIPPGSLFKKTCNVRINVTLRRVPVTVVTVEKQEVLRAHCRRVCSLSYTTCNAHAPHYIFTCGLSSCTVPFNIILKKTARFSGGGLVEHKMCVLSLSTTLA